MRKKEKTYIGCAEIRKENIERRDRFVEAAKAAGFIVNCAEAINISFSGASSPSFWYISVYREGDLVVTQRDYFRRILANAWKGL